MTQVFVSLKNNNISRLLLVTGLFLSGTFSLWSQRCPQDGITPEEFARRRVDLISKMDTSSILVMRAPETSSEYDQMNYRQDPDFLYLTGVDAPGYTLLLIPKGLPVEGRKKQCILFASSMYFSGLQNFSGENIPHAAFTGKYDTVVEDMEFKKQFRQALSGARKLYYSAPDLAFIHDWLNDKPYFIEKDVHKTLRLIAPDLKFESPAHLIAGLRQVKSPEELELIRNSIKITGDGILSAIRTCQPGIWEYELRAAIEYQMLKQGAAGVSFRSIIGAGRNSLSPHYMKNNCKTQEGEVVVMDVGASYHGYAADITRTIPVSGKFTKAQLEIYNVVLNIQEELIRMVRPGLTTGEIDKKAIELIKKAGYGKYILHGVTHSLGMEVHDVSASDTLVPGMVITIEPGIYIPEDDIFLSADYHTMGIRIEDDILVTKEGYEVLSEKIPKQATAMERRIE
ncbi:MAG: Xaa-Pro peptidase family protein [Bacteroidales bacterium]|jgi:Xaa-Pro aminopeptidase|nr:Xaa-Pro peptidase family protein [Bacteroidales bacterium]